MVEAASSVLYAQPYIDSKGAPCFYIASRRESESCIRPCRRTGSARRSSWPRVSACGVDEQGSMRIQAGHSRAVRSPAFGRGTRCVSHEYREDTRRAVGARTPFRRRVRTKPCSILYFTQRTSSLRTLSEILDVNAAPVVDLPRLQRTCAHGSLFHSCDLI